MASEHEIVAAVKALHLDPEVVDVEQVADLLHSAVAAAAQEAVEEMDLHDEVESIAERWLGDEFDVEQALEGVDLLSYVDEEGLARVVSEVVEDEVGEVAGFADRLRRAGLWARLRWLLTGRL